jgi:hypothetical protein
MFSPLKKGVNGLRSGAVAMWRKESFSIVPSTKLASTVAARFWGAVPHDAALVFPGHLLCGSRRSERRLAWAPHSLRLAARSALSPVASFQSLFRSFSAVAHSFQYSFRRGAQCLPFFLVEASLALRTARCMWSCELPVNKAFKTDESAVSHLLQKGAKAAPRQLRRLTTRYEAK